MKKLWILLPLVLCLCGCGNQKTYETMNDRYTQPQLQSCTLTLELPQEATQTAMEAEDGSRFYQCDGYTVLVQTLPGGDLDKSLLTVTGLPRERLTLMKTGQGDLKCYRCAWSVMGEQEEMICRAVLLDDGKAHYAVTVMAPYRGAGALSATWDTLLGSARLVSTD